MAKGIGKPAGPAATPYYRSKATRDEYLAFHYPERDPLPDFLGPRSPPLSERYPFAVRNLWKPARRALDIGCAVGRIASDLSRDHELAVGIDLSRELIEAGRGRGAARFAVADALALPFPDGAFDTVVALNLIDRVPDPARALAEAARVTAPRGLLLVGSPYTWKEEFTPRARWLGRIGDGGAEVRERLGRAFAREAETDLLFFIPHHPRSGQLGRAHIQAFRRQS
ncbi:MAG TPA: methyltransferase domain-containing protein [Planctomycetota bacterium]|nr:methyltransferase domain-containing protein [Planctomycetota bacterium]